MEDITEDDFDWLMITDGFNSLACKYGRGYAIECLQAVQDYLIELGDDVEEPDEAG